MTLRTITIKNSIAEIRAGATLLFDSIPELEEKETELKASAFLETIINCNTIAKNKKIKKDENYDNINNNNFLIKNGKNINILVIDHVDSFVNTLSNYFRQTGCNVTTVRYGLSKDELLSYKPDFAVLSPGPGKPTDFNCNKTIKLLIDEKIPIFGVCLGLQALVEYFGGELGYLDLPQHGKPAVVNIKNNKLNNKLNLNYDIFHNLPDTFNIARYHSIYGLKIPDCLNVTGYLDNELDKNNNKLCMAIEHKTLPIAAVQFHPESILTLKHHGLQIIKNAIENLKY